MVSHSQKNSDLWKGMECCRNEESGVRGSDADLDASLHSLISSSVKQKYDTVLFPSTRICGFNIF